MYYEERQGTEEVNMRSVERGWGGGGRPLSLYFSSPCPPS